MQRLGSITRAIVARQLPLLGVWLALTGCWWTDDGGGKIGVAGQEEPTAARGGAEADAADDDTPEPGFRSDDSWTIDGEGIDPDAAAAPTGGDTTTGRHVGWPTARSRGNSAGARADGGERRGGARASTAGSGGDTRGGDTRASGRPRATSSSPPTRPVTATGQRDRGEPLPPVPSSIAVPQPYRQLGGEPPIERVPVQVAVPSIDPATGTWATALADDEPRTAREWLQAGWDRKAEGDLDGAAEAFRAALEAGADPQLVELELGYLALLREDEDTAREHFREAKVASRARAREARAAMSGMSKPVWFDVYGDGYGWYRFVPEQSVNFVPTVRFRMLFHPFDKVDFDPYLFVQVSRDFASHGAQGPTGDPLVYADNSLMAGAGVMVRFWQKRIGLFAQVGPAINLLREDGREPVMLDFRAGAFAHLETPRCWPEPLDDHRQAEVGLDPCAELYAEAVYVSRFDHNLVGMLRARWAIGWLVTGPVAWQPLAEARVFKDINNDYWNNLVDAGVGHRWRLLAPIGMDFTLGVHVGSYFGLENEDPAPDPLYFAEFRFQLSTYIAF